jgi:hypothetical protein
MCVVLMEDKGIKNTNFFHRSTKFEKTFTKSLVVQKKCRTLVLYLKTEQ